MYCWGCGSLRPNCSRIFLTADALARGPAINRAGSPGMTCDRLKVMTDSPKRTTTRKSNRRTMSRTSMQPLAGGRRSQDRRPPRRPESGLAIHRIERERTEIEPVWHEALDVFPEDRVVGRLAIVDRRRILLGQDVLDFLHQGVEFRFVLEV